MMLFLTHLLKISGLYEMGYRNALDLRVQYKVLNFPALPENFHDFRILFMTDLHIGGAKELPDIIVENIKNIKVDICLFGGDYKFCGYTYPTRPFLAELEKIISNIQAPMGIYGVMGNHDDFKATADIENAGLRLLLNESVSLEKKGQRIYLVGVDEPFYHRRHDTAKAFHGISTKAFTICLIHAPEIYQDVENHGADLYLCGHTHHGQIRFPWIGPIVTGSAAPRSFSEGLWQYKNMLGYTSSGVGSGRPSIRFRCPPEITVFTLKSAKSETPPK